LDLWGTKLVVLSACETGVGAAKNGEGVYGLRRALMMAGAESQVMSLWKVADDATRDLMIAYYQGLLSGKGRAEALRQVQLAMLAGEDRSHPFYWASFIPSGQWTPLEGSLLHLRPQPFNDHFGRGGGVAVLADRDIVRVDPPHLLPAMLTRVWILMMDNRRFFHRDRG
jgi:hypothetical protein